MTMYMTEFNQIVNEHFDLSDKETRHFIATLEAANQDKLLGALSSALYDQIVAKVDDIDFGTIPLSRGDITKVQGFSNTEECLNIIRRLVMEYKQPTSVVDVVLTSIQNIKDRTPLFIKGYTLNVELPMLMYNLMVLSIERSVSLMIATCVQFVKDPASTSPKKALDKVAYQKTMDDMLFKQLISFNNMCKSGNFDKIIEAAMKNPVHEEVEFEYPGVQVPVAEEEPVENYPDSPVPASFDPFGDDVENAPEPEVEAPETEEPAPVPDAEPEADNFPEVKHDDEGNVLPPDGEPAPMDNGEEVANPDDVKDEVEPDNIPAVVPGEEISSSDAPINEEELNEGLLDNIGGVLSTAANGVEKLSGGKIKAKAVKIAFTAVAIASAIRMLPTFTIKVLIPAIRNLVYLAYYSSMKFSDYLEVQADFFEANAEEIESSSEEDDGLSDKKRKKVADKQRKLAEKLRKWANKFNIDRKEAENKAKKQAAEDEKNKKKIDTSNKKEDEDDGDLF